MKMTLKMHRQLMHERDIARDIAANIIKTSEELRISPACLLRKVEAELTTTINKASEHDDDLNV